MTLLTEDQINYELERMPGWRLRDGAVTRTVERADFRDALLLVGAVAFLAERADHHPDVLIQWNKVTLSLTTHSAGGVTAADVAMARQISELL